MPHADANPFLHQNKPSRESIFCGKVGVWWTKRALIMLNFLLKTRQSRFTVNTRGWTMARRVFTLTTASASGCRTCCSRTMETTSWKRWRDRHWQAVFSLCRPHWITSARQLSDSLPRYGTDKWCRISYLIVSLFGTPYMSGEFFLVLQHNDINSAQFVEMIEVKATSIWYYELMTL